MRYVNQHIIHCSDSTGGNVNDIREWHLARGWDDVGYHFVILKDGTIELGRPLENIGAHCKGQNTHSVGTCLIGVDSFTKLQFAALNRLHHTLRLLFNDIQPFGHRDFTDKKTCPNFEVREVIVP